MPVTVLPTSKQPVGIMLQRGNYRVRLAETEADRHACYRLRFTVFNVEMGEGLAEAYASGEDTDRFDAVCDHLMVEHLPSQELVGTYRLQTGRTAGEYFGYYSEQEFDLLPFEPLRDEMVELGRACLHPEHRQYETLHLLWHGIARYTQEQGCRYLIGCSSLHTQDETEGWAMHERLAEQLAPVHFQTAPHAGYRLDRDLQDAAASVLPEPPKLLRMYLMLGARLCGEPAIDRAFGTIDFLTMLDLEQLAPSFRQRYLNERTRNHA
jgi:putative hemolysin